MMLSHLRLANGIEDNPDAKILETWEMHLFFIRFFSS